MKSTVSLKTNSTWKTLTGIRLGYDGRTYGFGHGPHGGPRECMVPEESDQ